MNLIRVARFSFCRTYVTTPVAATGGKGKKKLGKMGAAVEKKVLPVETDARILVTHCCGTNIFKEGKDVELKPDSEYPDWLWNLHLGAPKKLADLDPDTKEYWYKVRKLNRIKHNTMSKLKKF